MSLATVEQFFQTVNWEGRSRKLKPALPEASGSPLCLRVGEFFSRHNWEGKPATLIEETVVKEMLITQTVQQFFAYLSWEGKPQVAKMPTPEIQRTPSLDSGSSDLNLNDLSDLF